MKIEGKGKLLKIFIGESDKWQHEALYHVIIKKIKENGLAGATTIRGIEGFGANSRVHTKNIEVLSQDLPR
jgi:PII-like signaling protein